MATESQLTEVVLEWRRFQTLTSARSGQWTRRPSLRSGRLLRSLGSPLNTVAFGGSWHSGSPPTSRGLLFLQGGLHVVPQDRGAATVTVCPGSAYLPAPSTIAEPSKQKQNDQDDDDESRC